jgi:hypothetical protein
MAMEGSGGLLAAMEIRLVCQWHSAGRRAREGALSTAAQASAGNDSLNDSKGFE